MKKISKLLIMILLLMLSTNVYAADYTYRTNKENRIKVNVNGYDLYMSVSVIYNINNEAMGERMPLESFSAEYKDDTFYVSVKRSELNKAFKDKTYDNVYALFEIAADFVDFKEDKKYFYIDQHSPESPVGEEYYLSLPTEDFFYRNYGIMEVENTAAELIGTANQAIGSKRGGFVLYETDSLPERKNSSDTYLLSEFEEYTPILKFDYRKAVISVIEDVQMDLGESKTIIDSHMGKDEETGKYKQETIDVNNFYAEYLDNNKMSYSWTMYDTEGKPLEISVDTAISMDNSENEEEIISLFGNEFDNIKDRIKIISFKHDGDLGGTAKVSLYVGDKFKPGSLVTLLYFNPVENTLENFGTGDMVSTEPNADRYTVLVDNDGYIAMELTHCSEYVVTEEEIAKEVIKNQEGNKKEEKDKKENDNKYIIIAIVTGVVVVLTTIVIITKKIIKKKKTI